MGCSQSKIENEEIISRCKERKQFMKEAVAARNGFAAAHSSYVMSLKNTGAALSDYAQAGLVQEPYLGHSQSVPVPTPSSSSYDDLRPPPPLPDFSPLHRASSMPEMKISKPGISPVGSSTIIEEGDEDDEIDNEESVSGLRRRRRSSNKGSGSSSVAGKREVLEQEEENPPPPPPSLSRTPPPQTEPHHMAGPLKEPYEYIFMVDNMPGPTLSEVGDVDINKEEIERRLFDKMPESVEEDGDVEEKIKTTSRKAEMAEPVIEMVLEPPPPSMAVQAGGKSSKKPKQVGFVGPVEGKRAAKGNVNLVQIFVELDDRFLQASQCAIEVSKMLEATRLHYHSNFADNRGHINHSDRVMRVITWNRSFKGMPNVNNGKDDFDTEEQETHATVLDKLLAWEKKLYDEVKAGEIMKFEYERKVATLEKLKKRSSNPESLEKVKAAVSHLHTRYIVDMQSLDSTVSEINRLRDQQLYPKLVQLVDGMSTMWDSMRIHHESQIKIASTLNLLDLSQSPKETSEHHRERTIQLWAIVQEWHSQFEKLVSRQKDYIRALNGWLKLNLIPIDSSLKEKVSSPTRIPSPPIKALLVTWHDFLENLPDEPLRTSIFTFAAVINTIMHHEEDEIKMKMKCEATRKELARKTRQFEDWHNKYVQKRIPDDPERGGEENPQRDVVAEKLSVLESVKKRLEEEEEAYLKQCLYVREKSLASLKSQLPELVRTLSAFSAESAKMYRHLRSISQSQNPRASAA